MDIQKEISLRNAISYCIENNNVNTATSKIMEFIRDEKEAIAVAHSSLLLNNGLKIDCNVKYKGEKGEITTIDLNKQVAKVYFKFMDDFVENIPLEQLTKIV